MAYRLPDNSGGPGAAQQLLSKHLERARGTHEKFDDTTGPGGPGYISGSPLSVDKDSGFNETGGVGEFHQAARNPENFGYFGDFLTRFREFDRQETGDGGFA
jgi:hypothetical protein